MNDELLNEAVEKKRPGRKPKQATEKTDVQVQVVTMLASILGSDPEALAAIKGATDNSEYLVYALICLYDDVPLPDVLKILKSGEDIPGRLTNLRNLSKGFSNHDLIADEVKPEVRKEPDEEDVTPITVNGNTINITPPSSPSSSKPFERIKRIFAGSRKSTTNEDRFKMYAKLLDDEMSQEQQEEILTAINAGLPYDVVAVIAKTKYKPEIIRYLAATYIKMTREANENE